MQMMQPVCVLSEGVWLFIQISRFFKFLGSAAEGPGEQMQEP